MKFQQPLVVLPTPHQDGVKQGRRCTTDGLLSRGCGQ